MKSIPTSHHRSSFRIRFLFIPLAILAQAMPLAAENQEPSDPHLIYMEVFIRGDSDRGKQASTFATELERSRPGIRCVIHDVLNDTAALTRLWQLARESGRDKATLPAFYCCDRLFFGFDERPETTAAIRRLYAFDVYTRTTCPRCKSAKEFLARTLQPRWPGLQIQIYDLNTDPGSLNRWQTLCQSRGMTPGLPTIDFAGRLLIGYQSDSVTGKQIEDLVQSASGEDRFAKDAEKRPALKDQSHRATPITLVRYQTEPIADPSPSPVTPSPRPDTPPLEELPPLPEDAETSEMGEAPRASVTPSPSTTQENLDRIEVPVFGELRVSRLGLPIFTFLVGIIDGFNPCAMWVLVFLLSVLVNLRDRRKIVAVAGTFVLISGAAYFAFMAAWLNLFVLVGLARPVQIALAILAFVIGIINVKDFFAFKKGVSLSIPESSKPGLYRRVREIVSAQYLTAAITGAVVLAIIVNMIELLCTAGLPAIYTQILTMQGLPWWENYAYLGLYILAYMLDDSLLLIAVLITLSHRKLQEREGRWLKLISGLVILTLGSVMLFRPGWLQLGH